MKLQATASGSGPPDSAVIIRRLRAAGCVFAEDEARLLIDEARTPAELADMVERRVSGQPLETILGWAEFCGLRVIVEPGVFVPRRRTEFLVDEAAKLAKPGSVVLDLCCGSGALGAALAASVHPIELWAADIDSAAVKCAHRNVDPVGGRVCEGDLFDALPRELRGRVDVILANTPYVPTGEIGTMPPEARDHEPHATLDGGADGLDVQRRVALSARDWLADGGHVLVEASSAQSPRSAGIFAEAGFAARASHSDEYDATVIIATRRN